MCLAPSSDWHGDWCVEAWPHTTDRLLADMTVPKRKGFAELDSDKIGGRGRFYHMGRHSGELRADRANNVPVFLHGNEDLLREPAEYLESALSSYIQGFPYARAAATMR